MLGQLIFRLRLMLKVLTLVCFAAQSTELSIVTEHAPPYQELDNNNRVTGFTTEIVNAALKQTTIDYSIRIYPWSRSFAMAKEQANTCIYSMSRNDAREKHFQWIAPIITTNDYFIGLSDRKDISVKSVEDIKNYNVAVLKDDRTHHMLLNMGFVESENLYVINNTYSMLKLLLTRKNIDFVLADTLNVEYRAKYNNIDPNLFRSYLKMNSEPVVLYLACSLTTPKAIVDELINAMATIHNNGVYQEIIHRWHQD